MGKSLIGEVNHRLHVMPVKLLRVERSKSAGKYLLYFHAQNFLTPNQYHKIYTAVLALLQWEFVLHFTYENKPSSLSDLGDVQTYVAQVVQEHGQTLPSIFKFCSVTAQGNELHFTFFNEISHAMFQQNAFDALVSDYFLTYLNYEVTVTSSLQSKVIQLEKRKPAAPPVEKKPVVVPAVEKKEDEKSDILRGKKITIDPIHIADLIPDQKNVAITGEIISCESFTTKDNKWTIVTLGLADDTGYIYAKAFYSPKDFEAVGSRLKGYAILRGNMSFDSYIKEDILSITDINLCAPPKKRTDNAKKKRVELHLHTCMSMMDAPNKVDDCIKRAIEWGHSAIAITDHGVVQSFPDADRYSKKIKILYGMEAYIFDDTVKDNTTYVVFDLETTGLDPHREAITEIGAVKIEGGEIVDTFSSFINPKRKIPPKITELTGITDEMVADAPDCEVVLQRFLDFAGDATLLAHNANFDMGFLRANTKVNNRAVDTIEIFKKRYPGLKSYGLSSVAKYLNVPLEHHRALNDAQCLAQMFLMSQPKGDNRTYHAVLLVKNKTGLKNLYKLVSASHLHHFYKRPRIPKSLLAQHRQGLLVGSACERGEIFSSILNKDGRTFELSEFYDYFELMPKANNAFMLREGIIHSEEELNDIYRKILKLAEKTGKLVVATTDTHFLDPKDEYFRRIIMHSQKFSNADMQAPLYFKTTEEMLHDFAFLGEDVAYKIVVENTNAIADSIETFPLLPKDTAMPRIDGANEMLKELCETTAKQIYGDILPPVVEKRLKRELDAILGHGFGVLYYIAHKLVQKSLSDGYLVGSRGSVGSSFAAFAAGITEVNPLPPHYVCETCKFSDFEIDHNKYECGWDLPHRSCPHCGQELFRTGFNIPFEVFLGINADKVPDIDLNFSSDYQPIAHAFTEELFGSEYVFRAGTISSLQEKTAYGHVRNYLDEKGIVVRKLEEERLKRGVSGVKKTTGQHPGGLVVVPRDMDIHDFTPVQRPANDQNSTSVTTHFDFNSLHDTLIKLDILGHDDPTVLKMLHELTGIDPKTLPLNDEETLSLFSSTKALGVTPDEIMGCKNGAIALPEFGTKFVRGMLNELNPTTVAELVRISGLSHGTNVWLSNAQDLIQSGIATLSSAICTRDDIMIYLTSIGVEERTAFFTMENVRKGKGLTPDMESAMAEKNTPPWFIESCKKISYMFPKAHAAAYVMMALRIAYYKVHHPLAFYAAYFSVRADTFSSKYVMGTDIKTAYRKLHAQGKELTAQQQDMVSFLEVAVEMYARGFQFLPIDLNHSHAFNFTPEGNALRLPFITIDGLGKSAAQTLMTAREEMPFISVEDVRKRGRVNAATVEKLREYGCFDGLPETDQLSLFAL